MYSQPSNVPIYVISETQTVLGFSAAKFCFSKFSATGRLCLEFVVALNFFFALPAIPLRFIRRATRFLLHFVPFACKSSVILGLPYTLWLFLCDSFISMSIFSFSFCLLLCGCIFHP